MAYFVRGIGFGPPLWAPDPRVRGLHRVPAPAWRERVESFGSAVAARAAELSIRVFRRDCPFLGWDRFNVVVPQPRTSRRTTTHMSGVVEGEAELQGAHVGAWARRYAEMLGVVPRGFPASLCRASFGLLPRSGDVLGIQPPRASALPLPSYLEPAEGGIQDA